MDKEARHTRNTTPASLSHAIQYTKRDGEYFIRSIDHTTIVRTHASRDTLRFLMGVQLIDKMKTR